MRLVHNQKTDRVKGILGKLALTHRLDQGNHKVLVGVECVPLDAAYGCSGAEGLNFFNPLIREELFVDHDHRTDF